ncbi:MAG: DUF1080 domain-containing protein [Planctomycetia bacterium]|nr:DUF1080 domain-containing protein [Planctomycetia bacterium]
MFRSLLAGVLATGVLIAAGLPGSTAQDKKDPPKKKERIAIAEPKDAAKDPDFAIQGEYEGTLVGRNGVEQKIGVQVIANGLGEFTVKALKGGLPGAGWDGKDSKKFAAVTGDVRVAVLNQKKEAIGTIGGGKIELTHDGATVTAKRVERKSKTLGEKPPKGAVVLFGKEGDEKNWANGRLLELSDGKFLTVARIKKADGKEQGGNITTKAKFGAFKAHIEFRLPWMPNSTGQGRGNSGVYLQDRYECQVLDSFGLAGENNECGGIYTQHKPSVNMCLPPMVWQTYDMEFTPAVFEGGKKTKNARATIYHNGVKIHDNVEFPKECPGGKKEEPTPGPFQFQDHGDPVIYRNVWVVEVK